MTLGRGPRSKQVCGDCWALGLVLAICLAAPAPAAQPTLTPPITVVPSAGLPPEVVDNRSNNNLHVIRHAGRVYMVFRTAKWHIASEDAKLYVVSSSDQVHWR